MREFHPALGQVVEVRCLDFLLTEAAKVTVAKVVGEDENQVRLGLRLAKRSRLGQGEQAKRGCEKKFADVHVRRALCSLANLPGYGESLLAVARLFSVSLKTFSLAAPERFVVASRDG